MTSVFLFLLAAQAQMAAPSWQGSIWLDGKAAPVQFVCAYESEDPFDEKKTRVEVLLSTIPVSGPAKPCKAVEAEAYESLKKTGAPVLQALLTMPGFVWDRATLYAGDKSYSHTFFEKDTTTKFESPEGGVLSGRMWTNGEAKVSNWPSMKVDVTFSVPFQKLVPKSPAITGAEALKHPAVIAARKFLAVMSSGDKVRIRAGIVEAERAQLDELWKSAEGAAMLEMMKSMGADSLKMPTVSVAMRGDVAEVAFERVDTTGGGKGRERMGFRMRQEQGEWRVTRNR